MLEQQEQACELDENEEAFDVIFPPRFSNVDRAKKGLNPHPSI
jgi:hypothetical protein